MNQNNGNRLLDANDIGKYLLIAGGSALFIGYLWGNRTVSSAIKGVIFKVIAKRVVNRLIG